MYKKLLTGAVLAALLIGSTIAPARAEFESDAPPPRPTLPADTNAADRLKVVPDEESAKVQSPETVPGQLVVRYKAGTSASAKSAAANAAGAKVDRTNGSLAVMAVDPTDLDTTQEHLEADPVSSPSSRTRSSGRSIRRTTRITRPRPPRWA